jgi:hypothetical protein
LERAHLGANFILAPQFDLENIDFFVSQGCPFNEYTISLLARGWTINSHEIVEKAKHLRALGCPWDGRLIADDALPMLRLWALENGCPKEIVVDSISLPS